MKLSLILPPQKMSWAKKLNYSQVHKKTFLTQLIFGSGQINDNFMK